MVSFGKLDWPLKWSKKNLQFAASSTSHVAQAAVLPPGHGKALGRNPFFMGNDSNITCQALAIRKSMKNIYENHCMLIGKYRGDMWSIHCQPVLSEALKVSASRWEARIIHAKEKDLQWCFLPEHLSIYIIYIYIYTYFIYTYVYYTYYIYTRNSRGLPRKMINEDM